jgi:hypothetical protein
MGMQKKAANRGRRERSPKQKYLICDSGQYEEEEEGLLI